MQTAALLAGRTRYLGACRRRYGEVVRLRTLFGPPFVVVFDPALIAELFRVSPEHAMAGAANAASEPLHGGSSLLLLDGAEHLRQRRLLLPPFHGERMRAFAGVIRDACDRQIDGWPVGEPFELAGSMHALTLEVIMRAVFGVDTTGPNGGAGAALAHEVRAMLAAGRRGFERHRDAVETLLRAEIARRRAVDGLETRVDVLSTLIAAGRDDEARAMSDSELHDELITLLVAGHETTAGALTWAFELVLNDQRVLGCLRASLAAGKDDYLDAVIKETLRLRPVVTGLGRLVGREPMAVGEFQVPPGHEVTPAIDVVHAAPDAYPNAESFRPERFLEAPPPPPESWIPFGGGTRRCIGASFAAFEMRVAIARVLERAELRPAAEGVERGARRRVTPPTRAALARALRRGRREVPRRGARVILLAPPRNASDVS